ncbi:molybdate transport system regulatory protein [Lacrimispora sphenoides]|jgi:molybdate transport system regulatory protein|uniref:winged helix-turn-helix domain-containing protein n=1 Tax=Lacrimispora sphenoides TaxID=29370 RepID=UPI0008B631BF|nr:LysR family transcriptional regulator [Lacrimispora sphenoides]SEU26324.1 molybdate transport system regulatory protein [Lacrimispora sphenoides]
MRVVTRIRIGKDKIFIGKGVKEMLDAIELYKSIKKATEQTGISYPKAIRMIRTLEEELGFPVVISEKGGNERGGTRLTEKGKEVLETYRRIEKAVEEYAENLVEQEFRF